MVSCHDNEVIFVMCNIVVNETHQLLYHIYIMSNLLRRSTDCYFYMVIKDDCLIQGKFWGEAVSVAGKMLITKFDFFPSFNNKFDKILHCTGSVEVTNNTRSVYKEL